MIRSLPLTALSLLLGFFFIFVGLIKVTPKVNPDIYKDMQQEFGRFNKVFPFYKLTGWRPYAKNFRLFTGWLEVVCGAILVMIPGPLKELASFLLLIVMVGGFYTHFALNDSFERIAPSLIFSLLIICRFIILYQVKRKEKKEEEMIKKLLEESAQNETKSNESKKDE
ncbi:transmembrane 35-like [Brachionus plicatilis]|uniref:Novel acetylcholine receptor chaperone n=1 Tax=Brachionus plicatilis TaxID=10195 RepID=A0A3M7RXY9_BRAPC|nr:transmembrane 35-like [Brachionus plicatilis]